MIHDLQATMKVRALLGKHRQAVSHIPSIPYHDAPAFYNMLCQRDFVSCLALRFLMLTVARTSEVRLARFDEMDFVKMALATQSPVIPISVVGAEETYLALAQSQTMSRLTRWPYFPISPTFPWLGLLGLAPLPTKWAIDFGQPIAMDSYGPGDADNLVLVSQITDQVRNIIQDMVQRRLAQRRSVLLG